MRDRSQYLKGCRILILEDEYFIANDLETALKAQGAKVIGPFAKLSEAMSQVARDEIDAVVMDVNLRDGSAYSVSDELARQHVPFIFATGYSAKAIPNRFRHVTRWEKPYDVTEVVNDLARLCEPRSEQKRKAPGRSGESITP
ncbi:MAG: response regulator [Halobacteriota archaeon]